MKVLMDSTSPCQAKRLMSERMRRWEIMAKEISSNRAARRLTS
jgi:hypothetical protein